MSKGLLITGATGQQGGAVVNALVSSPSPNDDFTILAVTRNPTSAAAQRLTSLSPNIKLVQGDLNDVPALFTSAKSHHSNIHGVFSVQVPMGQGQTVTTEETQGKALVDAALAAGVKHFVYTSVDRGGEASFNNQTDVPHFLSKHRIEHHLVDKTKGTTMQYTILRPTAFMENFSPGFFAKVFGAAWKLNLPAEQGMQLVSVRDVGRVAAEAFRNPQKWGGKGISLAGDEPTFKQADEAFKAHAGTNVPETWSIFGRGLMWASHDMERMMNFIGKGGYKADVAGLRKEFPGMLTLGEYLEKHSAWAKK
ncbi:NmrA-like protein 5 [Elsinoe fawcettii]|nr:NmrA-like protein 5 [Elsinoe fawcettii]